MDIREMIQTIHEEKQSIGGIQQVIWLAAGGSYGGFYPGHYFLDQESTKLRSKNVTSNEFVKAPPAFVNETTLAVICSMRGTPETIEAAKVAKKLGAATIALYIDESELTEVCDYKIHYDSVAVDESDFSKTNAAYGLKLAMTVMDVVEGYEHMTTAMKSLKKSTRFTNKRSRIFGQKQSNGRFKIATLNPFMSWVVVPHMEQPTFSRFAILWKCCKLIHQPSIAVISSMDLLK